MKKKIMAVLLALAMVTQGAMPVFAQNEGAEGIETGDSGRCRNGKNFVQGVFE